MNSALLKTNVPLRLTRPLLVVLTATACSSHALRDRADGAAPPSNLNTSNPTLQVFQNRAPQLDGPKRLVWSEEFEGAALNPQTWFFEHGDGSQYGLSGWGNSELQWYLPENAQIADGRLTISVRREAQSGKSYTSARISTADRFAFRYGRIEARMRLPKGQGIWPAFWLLPQEDIYGTWAASGEIDVMEAVNLGGSGGNTVLGTIHYGGVWPENRHSGAEYIVPNDVTEGFHVYAVEWGEEVMRWYVDDTLYATQTDWSTPSAEFPAPFDQPFYILLNVAVGGNLPGPPAEATQFPVSMEVDYVRVYSGD